MEDFVITQPVAVVPLVLEATAGPQPDLETSPALADSQVADIYQNHVKECVSDVVQGRNSAVIAYGDAAPRGRALLCMPSAHHTLPCSPGFSATVPRHDLDRDFS